MVHSPPHRYLLRLNADLGEFVELIYSRRFKPMKTHDGDIARELKLWLEYSMDSGDMVREQARCFLLSLADAMDTKSPRSTDLRPPRIPPTAQIAKGDGSQPLSFVLIRTRFSVSHLPYESHVKAEARLAVALVLLLREAFGVDKNIFVATPHRIQRAAVSQALALSGQTTAQGPAPDGEQDPTADPTDPTGRLKVSHENLRVDTVEKLQGTLYFIFSKKIFSSSLLSHCNFNRCRGIVCDLPTFPYPYPVVVQPCRLSSDKAASQCRYQSSKIPLYCHFESRGSQSWHGSSCKC
jgi:hypothetical protein